MFISSNTLKNLQRRLKTLEEEHFSEAGKLRGRISDAELGVEKLKSQQTTAKTDLGLIESRIDFLKDKVKSLESSRSVNDANQNYHTDMTITRLKELENKIESLQDAQRANLESVGITFSEADKNFDELTALLENQEETLVLLAEAILEIIDSQDERTFAHGKSRSKTSK